MLLDSSNLVVLHSKKKRNLRRTKSHRKWPENGRKSPFPTEFATEMPSVANFMVANPERRKSVANFCDGICDGIFRRKCRTRKWAKGGFRTRDRPSLPTSHQPPPSLPSALFHFVRGEFRTRDLRVVSLARIPLGQLVFHVVLHVSVIYIFKTNYNLWKIYNIKYI